jgi:cytochrome c oxidase assembly protein subunit 15
LVVLGIIFKELSVIATKRYSSYKKALNLSILIVFFLILVGGLVRSTGSGLGCPDWPKCFGQYIPPTHISELPVDYKEKFKIAGKTIADFNPVKTWTEYINRLVGAVTGVVVFIMALFSLKYRGENSKVIILSWLAVFSVGFNGWLGAIVVATHLKPVIITLHMLMAVVTIFLLLQAKIESEDEDFSFYLDKEEGKSLKKLVIFTIFLSAIQIVIGTQVREAVDHILPEVSRSEWISQLGMEFLVHRSFSILLVIAHIFLFLKVKKLDSRHTRVKGWANLCTIILLVNIISGVTLSYGGFPASVQPPHLLFGLMLACAQYYLLAIVSKSSALEV